MDFYVRSMLAVLKNAKTDLFGLYALTKPTRPETHDGISDILTV